MAYDPSTSSTPKRKHGRHPTPVLPALPLSFPDRRKGKPAQLEVQDNALAPSSSSTHQQTAQSAEAPTIEHSDHVRGGEGVDLSRPSDVHVVAAKPANGDVATTSEERPASIKHDAAPVRVLEEDTTREEIKSQGDDTINEEVPAPTNRLHEPQAATVPGEVQDTDVTSAKSGKRSQPSEDEVQFSEPELSSVQPSSATGITDYGSSVAESALDTAVDDSQHARKPSTMPHRKSEIAPEVFTNGVSPPMAHDSPATHNHAVNGTVSHPPLASEVAPIPNMQDYLLFLASGKQFSDIVLQVNQANRSYQPSLHYAHHLLLLRSEKLAKLTPEFDQTIQAKVINLFPARNILPHAFEAAVRFFYSDNVLTAQSIVPQGTGVEPQFKAQALDYVLSYWMAGVELGLAPVKVRSFELVKELLEFDVAELIAKEIRHLRAAVTTMRNTHDQAEVRGIANTLSRLLAQLFSERLDFKDFTLDTEASATIFPPRFAQLEFNRSNNPALSGVVFGSLPSPANPPSASSIASFLMLNIDFDDLAILASELTVRHGTAGEDVIRQVVKHREEQREHMVSNRSVSNKQRLSNSELWNPAGWKESITESGKLERDRVGFLLPNKTR